VGSVAAEAWVASTAARFRPEDCTSVHTRDRTAKEEKKSVTTVLSMLMRNGGSMHPRKPRNIFLLKITKIP